MGFLLDNDFDRALVKEFEPALEIDERKLAGFLRRCGIEDALATEEALAIVGAGGMTERGFVKRFGSTWDVSYGLAI